MEGGRDTIPLPSPSRVEVSPGATRKWSGESGRPESTGRPRRASVDSPPRGTRRSHKGGASPRSPLPPLGAGRDRTPSGSRLRTVGKPVRMSGHHAAASGADLSPPMPFEAAGSSSAKRRRLSRSARESLSFAEAAGSDTSSQYRYYLDEVRTDDRSLRSSFGREASYLPHPPDEGRLDRMERILEQVLLNQKQDTHRSRGLMDISPSPSMDSIRPDEEAILVHAPAAPEVPQEDLLDVAAKFGLPVSSGQPLNTKLAATIDYLTNHQLQEEVLAKAMERHKAPGNCNSLNVPIVNMPIWGNISPGIRVQEVKLQRILKLLTAGITAFAKSVDGVDLSTEQEDALALLCNTQYEINAFRKSIIKPSLNPKFAGLCRAPPTPPPRQLFGEDLPKQVKELDDHAKTIGLMRPHVVTRPSAKKTPYFRPRGQTDRPTRTYVPAPPQYQQPPQPRPFLGLGPQRPAWKMRIPHQPRNPAPPRPTKNPRDHR